MVLILKFIKLKKKGSELEIQVFMIYRIVFPSIMYKLKTHSGAKKRFKATSSGKILRAHANKSHILNKKTRKRKRNLRSIAVVDKTNTMQIMSLMPYSF